MDDCSCKVESVDSFNNLKIYPRLNSLLEKDYFKYWKVSFVNICSFKNVCVGGRGGGRGGGGDPVRLSSRTSFWLMFGLGLVPIYLQLLVWETCISKQASETSGCK